jgi:diguanylate cyclase (GGDEF)-like protein
LLPDTDVKNAGTLAEMLRHSIESLGIDHLESNVSESVTISLGVASRIPNEDTSLPDLISDADRALYRAKNAGRNRVSSLNGTLPLN